MSNHSSQTWQSSKIDDEMDLPIVAGMLHKYLMYFYQSLSNVFSIHVFIYYCFYLFYFRHIINNRSMPS